MKKIIPLIFVSILLFACQNIKYPDKPKDLIPEEKMSEILIDIHLFNVAKNFNRLPLQQTGMTADAFIYEKHGIDSLQYEASNRYYGSNLEKYNELHSKVLSHLQKEKSKLDTVIVTRKRVQDSIKKVNDSIRRTKNDTVRPQLQIVMPQ